MDKPKLDKARIKEAFKSFPGKAKNGLKRLWDGIRSIPSRIKKWFLGTEEKPVPTFGYRARLYRWFLIHFRHHVYYYQSWFDKEEVEYVLDKSIIPRKKLPPQAVPVTNMKHTYHVDMDIIKRGFSTIEDNGFTAVDLWIYMKSNKFEEAMRVNLDAGNSIDMKKLVMVMAVIFGIFLGIYFFVMPSMS